MNLFTKQKYRLTDVENKLTVTSGGRGGGEWEGGGGGINWEIGIDIYTLVWSGHS